MEKAQLDLGEFPKPSFSKSGEMTKEERAPKSSEASHRDFAIAASPPNVAGNVANYVVKDGINW